MCPSWPHLGPSWPILAASRMHVGPSCRILIHLVPSWLYLGAILVPSWPTLAPSWTILAPFGPILAPSWPRGPTLPNLSQVYHHCQLDYTERLNLSQICYSRLIPSGPVFVVPLPFPSAAFVCPSLSNFLSNSPNTLRCHIILVRVVPTALL